METKNYTYDKSGNITCELNHPNYGWIPYTASPFSEKNDLSHIVYKKILDLKKLGKIKILPYSPTEEFGYSDLESIARAKRDSLLLDSDWSQLPDVPIETREAFSIYRKNLRDIPSQSSFPEKINWPVHPVYGDIHNNEDNKYENLINENEIRDLLVLSNSMVLTKLTGYQEVKNLKESDILLSFSVEGGFFYEVTPIKISKTLNSSNYKFLKLNYSINGGEETICLPETSKIATTAGVTSIKNLTSDDTVFSPYGKVVIKSIQKIKNVDFDIFSMTTNYSFLVNGLVVS